MGAAAVRDERPEVFAWLNPISDFHSGVVSKDELAFVLAHELGHIYLGHAPVSNQPPEWLVADEIEAWDWARALLQQDTTHEFDWEHFDRMSEWSIRSHVVGKVRQERE